MPAVSAVTVRMRGKLDMPGVIMKTFGGDWDQRWILKNAMDMDCRTIESPMGK